MASDISQRDPNRNIGIQGVSTNDLLTPTNIAVDPTTKHLQVDASVTLSGTSDVNITKYGGTSTTLGQKAMTASMPVVLASDQASIPVAATLTAETTKVIGTVNQGTSPWVISGAVTNTILSVIGGGTEAAAQRVTLASDSTGVLTVKQATGTNLHAVLDTTSTTAVTQATGTNLHAVLDSGTVTTVSTVTNLSQIATVTPTFGAVANSATITGTLDVLPVGQYNSAPSSITDGRYNFFQLDLKGSLRTVTMDAAGNARGANVDANNNMGVVLAAETTKVLGVTRTADGAGNLLTSNSTTPSAKFSLDQNITSILGTAPTTVGKLDVKGADGDVFVRQTTASNLNMTEASASSILTSVQLIDDTITAQGTALGSTKTSLVGGSVTTNAPTFTTGQINQLSLTTGGGLRIDLKDTVANTNNLNVNLAASAATVTVSATNLSTNVAQMNGATVSMGVGATGTGVQRTVLANDAGKTLASKGGSASSAGDNTLVVAGTNRLKVYAFSLSTVSTTAVTCIFQSGASGTELWRVVLQTPASVAGGANLVVQPPAWLFATASATLLNLNLSAAVAVHWSVSYYDEA